MASFEEKCNQVTKKTGARLEKIPVTPKAENKEQQNEGFSVIHPTRYKDGELVGMPDGSVYKKIKGAMVFQGMADPRTFGPPETQTLGVEESRDK